MGSHKNGKNTWIVYSHTNKVNGKIYIGITSKDPNARWKNGKGYQYNTYFYNAICKYGWDSFSHNILFSGLTEEEAKQKEVELISNYNSNNRDYGYNLTAGGDGAVGRIVSEETKQKISTSHIGLKHTEESRAKISESLAGNKRALGYHHTEETKAKISEAGKGNQYTKGYHHSELAKQKIAEAHRGRIVSEETRRKLSEINTGRKHTEESKIKMSTNRKGIASFTGCKHREDSKRKMSESRIKYFEDHPEARDNLSSINKIPVDMFTIDGEYIRTFDSAIDAKKEFNIDNSSIIKVCKGKAKTAGGYKWQYHKKTS